MDREVWGLEIDATIDAVVAEVLGVRVVGELDEAEMESIFGA